MTNYFGDWQDSLKLFYLVNKVLQLCTVLVTNILLITKTDSLVFQMEIPFPFTLTNCFIPLYYLFQMSFNEIQIFY